MPAPSARSAHLTVGGFRDWLLADETTAPVLKALAGGLTPEMAAAVSKICRLQDLMAIAAKCTVVTAFRNTLGLPGRLSVRLQPNHPTDDARGIAASIFDGLLLGSGDAVIGINPATDSPASTHTLLSMLDEIISKLDIPTQSCVLAHVTTTLDLIRKGAPVDSCSSRSPAPRPPTKASASISRCLRRRARRRYRSAAARRATM